MARYMLAKAVLMAWLFLGSEHTAAGMGALTEPFFGGKTSGSVCNSGGKTFLINKLTHNSYILY